MNIKKMISISLYFTSILVFANNTQLVPQFAGGLNIEKIKLCEQKYQQVCVKSNASNAMEAYVQQSECITKKLAGDKACAQASKIRQLTNYPAEQLKKYGEVTVFDNTTLADGVTIFYMVDKEGHLINLTTGIDLSKNADYIKLKKEYPNLALTNFIYWTKINENVYPQEQILEDKTQQIIFKQELRDGECVACARVGYAEIAYEFNAQGIYLDTKLLGVKSH